MIAEKITFTELFPDLSNILPNAPGLYICITHKEFYTNGVEKYQQTLYMS